MVEETNTTSEFYTHQLALLNLHPIHGNEDLCSKRYLINLGQKSIALRVWI